VEASDRDHFDRGSPLTREIVFLVWIISIGTVCVLSLLPKVYTPVSFWNSDKVYHCLWYAWLSGLPALAFREAGAGFKAGLAMFFLGVVLECLQFFIPGRFFSIADIAANGVGVLVGARIGKVIKGSNTSA